MMSCKIKRWDPISRKKYNIGFSMIIRKYWSHVPYCSCLRIAGLKSVWTNDDFEDDSALERAFEVILSLHITDMAA